MNIEQEKTEAQERIAQEQPEEARTLSETGELSDGELDGVNGGFSLTLNIQTGRGKKKPWPAADKKKPQASTLVYDPTTPPVASTLEHRGDAGGKVELL